MEWQAPLSSGCAEETGTIEVTLSLLVSLMKHFYTGHILQIKNLFHPYDNYSSLSKPQHHIESISRDLFSLIASAYVAIKMQHAYCAPQP